MNDEQNNSYPEEDREPVDHIPQNDADGENPSETFGEQEAPREAPPRVASSVEYGPKIGRAHV